MTTPDALQKVPNEDLLSRLKALVGRSNQLTAHVLAHLAEVEARGIYRELACSSLYAYCVYELRMSEDEAQRRILAARAARRFPLLLEMLESAAIHLTGIVLLAPHLTDDNHEELLARARYRSKREIQRLIAEVAPKPDVPAKIEPLGPQGRSGGRATWAVFAASLAGGVRDLPPGTGPGQAPSVAKSSAADDDGGRREVVDYAIHPRRRAPGGVEARRGAVRLRRRARAAMSRAKWARASPPRGVLPRRGAFRREPLALLSCTQRTHGRTRTG